MGPTIQITQIPKEFAIGYKTKIPCIDIKILGLYPQLRKCKVKLTLIQKDSLQSHFFYLCSRDCMEKKLECECTKYISIDSSSDVDIRFDDLKLNGGKNNLKLVLIAKYLMNEGVNLKLPLKLEGGKLYDASDKEVKHRCLKQFRERAKQEMSSMDEHHCRILFQVFNMCGTEIAKKESEVISNKSSTKRTKNKELKIIRTLLSCDGYDDELNILVTEFKYEQLHVVLLKEEVMETGSMTEIATILIKKPNEILGRNGQNFYIIVNISKYSRKCNEQALYVKIRTIDGSLESECLKVKVQRDIIPEKCPENEHAKMEKIGTKRVNSMFLSELDGFSQRGGKKKFSISEADIGINTIVKPEVPIERSSCSDKIQTDSFGESNSHGNYCYSNNLQTHSMGEWDYTLNHQNDFGIFGNHEYMTTSGISENDLEMLLSRHSNTETDIVPDFSNNQNNTTAQPNQQDFTRYLNTNMIDMCNEQNNATSYHEISGESIDTNDKPSENQTCSKSANSVETSTSTYDINDIFDQPNVFSMMFGNEYNLFVDANNKLSENPISSNPANSVETRSYEFDNIFDLPNDETLSYVDSTMNTDYFSF